jgi:hypothetical protein
MVNDPRDTHTNVARLIKGFDNITAPGKLTPNRSLEVDATVESTLAAYRIRKMLLSSDGKLYGAGTVSAVDGHSQVYVKNGSGGPTDQWTTATATSTNASSVLTAYTFFEYHGVKYGSETNGLWRYGDVGGGVFSFVHQDDTHVPTGQGIVHSKDDAAYVPCSNVIIRTTTGAIGSWTVALTLPTGSTIANIWEHGNYLAIACNQTDGTMVIYLWDRDASLSTLSEKIDWGRGTLAFGGSIGGTIVGVSVAANTLSSLTPRLYLKWYDGTLHETELVCSTLNLTSEHQQFNDVIYFLADVTLNGTDLFGLWKLYMSAGRLCLTFDQAPRNDTSLGGTGRLNAFLRTGDYTLISYLEPTNLNFTIWRTNATNNYLSTSTFESTINENMPEADKMLQKQLALIAASCEPLTSGQQLVVKYRVDDGSWRTVATITTTGTVVNESVFEADGNNFASGREYEFDVESTNGAEFTGLEYGYEPIATNL